MEVLLAAVPFASLVVSIWAIWRSGQSEKKRVLSDRLERLEAHLDKHDANFHTLSVQLAKHLPDYENGIK